MKNLLISVFILASLMKANGQQYYPIFTQNYANPFLVNPSLLTLDRKPEINALFRQQWVGISDGPQTLQLDLQYPFNPKVSVGLNLYNDQSILLSNSGALATFGYRVRLSSRHILGFGLSAGFVSNQIDLEGVPDLDLIDPVLLNSSNNFDFDGQFGMHYRSGNLIFGVSLLKLVDNRPFSEGAVQVDKFDPFKDRSAILGYRLNLSDEISLQPTLYYRSTFSGYEYFEGSMLISYKNIVTIGGGYRLDFGPHAMIRLRLKDLHAGYAYDFPNTRFGGSTGGTHEVQLKFQFKKIVEPLESLVKVDTVKKYSPPETTVAKTEKVEEPVVQPTVQNEKTQTIEETVPPVISEPEPEPIIETNDPIVEQRPEPPQEQINGPTYDLVVGVFVRKFHADRYGRQLHTEGITTEVKTKSETGFFYVTIPKYATKSITLERVLEIRNSTQFKDAWFERFE